MCGVLKAVEFGGSTSLLVIDPAHVFVGGSVCGEQFDMIVTESGRRVRLLPVNDHSFTRLLRRNLGDLYEVSLALIYLRLTQFLVALGAHRRVFLFDRVQSLVVSTIFLVHRPTDCAASDVTRVSRFND